MNLQLFQKVGSKFVAHQQVVRSFKSDLKIKWVRPEKIPCFKPEKTGDCSQLPEVNSKEYLVDYLNSKELKSASPEVQSLFQLEKNPRRHVKYLYRQELIQKVQRHPQDYGSMEAKLAKMTATIHYYQNHMESHPRDVKVKVSLKELIDKRKKFLKFLRRWDYRRFEWILEKLDLIYKPPPNEFHWITRKESLQKLTDKYCEEVKEQRLQEYRQKLEAQQIPFLEDAIKKMEKARQDQIEWELKEYVTEAQIIEAKTLLESLYAKRASAESNNNSNDTK